MTVAESDYMSTVVHINGVIPLREQPAMPAPLLLSDPHAHEVCKEQHATTYDTAAHGMAHGKYRSHHINEVRPEDQFIHHSPGCVTGCGALFVMCRGIA